MKKILIIIVVILLGSFFYIYSHTSDNSPATNEGKQIDITKVLQGQMIPLDLSLTIPESSHNDREIEYGDINNDGKKDAVVLLPQNYAAAQSRYDELKQSGKKNIYLEIPYTLMFLINRGEQYEIVSVAEINNTLEVTDSFFRAFNTYTSMIGSGTETSQLEINNGIIRISIFTDIFYKELIPAESITYVQYNAQKKDFLVVKEGYKPELRVSKNHNSIENTNVEMVKNITPISVKEYKSWIRNE